VYEQTHRRDGAPPGGRGVSGTDDEDWFEKALRQGDEETDGDDTSADEAGETDDEIGPTPAGETDTPAAGDSGPAGANDSFGGDQSASDGDSFGGDEPSDAFTNGHSVDDSGDDPFGGGGDSFDGGGDSFDDVDSETGDSFGGDDDSFDGADDDSFDGADDDSFGGDDDPFGGTQTSDDTDPVGEQPDTGGDSFGGTDDDSFGGTDDDSPGGAQASDDPFGGVQSGGSPEPTGDTDSDPFGGQASDAGGDPFGGTQTDDSGGTGGGGTGGDDPFGGAQSAPGGDDDTPFGEGFDDAMGGGMGGGGGTEFDEEEFESEIERIDVGIEGLDDMILGGVPIRSLMTVIGSAGTGKTTFGIQFLDQAMRTGGSGVYITLEETEEAIISTAEEKGWPFEQYVADDKLTVVAMDPIEMANSLDSIRGDISRLVNDFGADRLVLDSVSLLEMMYDHPAKRRSEVFDFARSLKRAGVTTMLTSEANADNSYQSRHGLVEYLVDAVFVLQYVRPNDFQETRLAVEIQKIRDANHSRETKPYDITDDGISVYRQANIF